MIFPKKDSVSRINLAVLPLTPPLRLMAGDERGGHGAADDDYGPQDGRDGEAVHSSGTGVFEGSRADDGETEAAIISRFCGVQRQFVR